MHLRITGVANLPDIRKGDDLAALIRAAAPPITARTIVVVAQKIVSKAEGALVDLAAVEPSPFAREWAAKLVPRPAPRRSGSARVAAHRQNGSRCRRSPKPATAWWPPMPGWTSPMCPGECRATLLPRDPDASARGLRDGLGAGAVIVSDTFGRPWRDGLVNVAIGVAGLRRSKTCAAHPTATAAAFTARCSRWRTNLPPPPAW